MMWGKVQLFLCDQCGVVVVEFVVVVSLFFIILIGIVEMGWLLWIWNVVVEVMCCGVCFVVVCLLDDLYIKIWMCEMLFVLLDVNISIVYLNLLDVLNICMMVNCKVVSVSLMGYMYQMIIFFVLLFVFFLFFQIMLLCEYMESSGNFVCN